MALSWVATEMRTGAVLEAFPDLTADSVKDTLGQYETGTVTLPLATAPPSWLRATKPGATVLNLIDTDANVCVWGGFITQRPRTEGDTMDLAVATLPAYFDRRYVGDKTYLSTDQNAIVADLVRTYAAGGSNGGIPIRTQIVGGAGTQRDRTYADDDDKTLYSVLQDLMGIDGGPEWYVGWESGALADGRQTWTPVLYVGARLGASAPPGLAPSVTAELPGTASAVTMTEDYSSSSGANDVMAYSTSTGDTRPESSHHVYADPDRPTFEYRWSPSTSITDVSTLESHAVSQLAAMQDGSTDVAMSFLNITGRALGVDWAIGDDLGYKLSGLGFPDTEQGVQRTWGWEISLDDPVTVTPTLVKPGGSDAPEG